MLRQKNPQPPLRVGVFGSLEQADQVIVRLVDAGFRQEDIVVVAPVALQKHFEAFHAEVPAGTRTIKAAPAGAAVGAVIGGILAAAAVVGTGGGALVIAGPLIAGASAGGVWGGFIGAMLTRGFEEEAAQFYDQALRKGKILVGVQTPHDDPEKLALAEQVLERAGAEPLSLRKG
jgi:hypothetical protein